MVGRFPRGFGVHDRTPQVGRHIDRVGKRAAMRDVKDATFGRGPLAGRTGNVFKDDPFFNPWAEGGAFNKDPAYSGQSSSYHSLDEVNRGDSRPFQEVDPAWREEQEKSRAVRLARTKEAAQQVIAGLDVLKGLPGSNFTFEVTDHPDRLYITTNVPKIKIDRDGNGGNANIIIDCTEVSAYYFSQEMIRGSTAEPAAFLKALESVLVARTIVPALPARNGNVTPPSLDA